ncbi:RES domain-containing protein (plasmid) [Caballeronia sp. NK8]|uniref:HEPN-associated N-terminal domain-containing protein n=1 Tax=Caballeronia sp. NK8 TaxID=140098 RepID=UPI001BB64494|nr:HEPN-associated N-terminal domain-containing protein [Caballeronia sp. NK8]BCQ28251.1 RES domain-containing protein [Caballeronia sp. NK8]
MVCITKASPGSPTLLPLRWSNKLTRGSKWDERKHGLWSSRRKDSTRTDTRVCNRCIVDLALRRFIKKEGEKGLDCSYCDADSQGKKSVEFDRFVERVLRGIQSEWGEPNNEGVPWEQGWVGDVFDTYDILTEEIDIGFAHDSLFKDVVSSLSDHQWCQKNFYELEPHQALSAGWKEFASVVKHESRYVFFRRDDARARWRGGEEIPPSEFLDALGAVNESCGLYKTLPAGTAISRLRLHAEDEKLTKAGELGSPPADKAKFANRMSAAGISAFYGAFDKATAIAETTTSLDESTWATLGHFRLLKDIRVVDLTKLPNLPGVFEPDSRSERQGIVFLRDFLDDFTAPIKKDGREHIEYVPTQVVAEYLRFVHRDRKNRAIDGVLYKSARQTGSQACVLFVGAEAACDPGDEDSDKILVLDSTETFEIQPTPSSTHSL